ncbi:hypothetical protein GGR58DRAFT_492447 [Xylaria digitata]|nr:hypothetical protein GGR58DRAFT_492447 [Xylaria digitata]
MRPSSFFGVLVVAVSSLPTSQFNDPLTGILPDLLQSANGLLGGLLGHHDHKEPSLLPCLFDNTFCAGGCTSDCLRKPQTVSNTIRLFIPLSQIDGPAVSHTSAISKYLGKMMLLIVGYQVFKLHVIVP